jgi:hypothetical protein
MRRKALITSLAIFLVYFTHSTSHSQVVSEDPPDAPAEHAGRQETLQLLRAENYSVLDKKMNGLQEAYEQGIISDESLLHGFRAFYDTDPLLERNYQAWLAAYPNSYLAHLAHATYYILSNFGCSGSR